ncbi:MAG: sulfurtransferase [Gammaproteobacteria bacterium]|nr:sulfurtransferase [Gammaproteobacteria bacterium]|tara:strand:+ start:2479 stop:2886 length:408 start_codon:yes stop_codon:yes gene_type:complete
MELINFLIEHYFLSAPLLVFIILLLISNSNKGGKKISPQTLISLSNQDNAFLVDLRDSESFQSGHITNSINIPFNNLSNSTNQINQKDKSIILICEMGSTSPNAGEILKKEGFLNILILKGGINEWKIQNLPLVL